MKSIQSILRSKHLLMLQSFPLPTQLLYLLLICCICNACTRNDDTETAVLPFSESIRLEVTMPSSQQILSYAGGVIDENYIESADALVFNGNTFAYHSIAHGITGTGASRNMKIKLNPLPTSVSIMLIVNARAEITAALTANAFTGKTKDQIMSALTFNSSGKWPVSTGSWKPLPMWGISTGAVNSSVSTPVFITLLRSVAKIDVGVKFEDNSDVVQGLGKQFVLTSVTLHNAPTKLNIAPLAANLTNAVVTAPTVPAGGGLNNLGYTVSDGKSCMNQIYLGESAVATLATNKVCLVIGGKWSDTDIEGSTTTYYRIDFVKNTLTDGIITAQEYLPILRNHQYKVNIKNVACAGYSTPELAFNALGVNTNLAVDITESDSEITDIISNQQYYLGVGGLVMLTKNAHANVDIYIITNNPSGWTLSALPSWISKVKNHSKGIVLKVDKNDTYFDRTAEIVVTAGLLQRTIKVVQERKEIET